MLQNFDTILELLSGDLNQDRINAAKELLKGHQPQFKINPLESAKHAYLYARDILKAPFPEGEDLIATETCAAYEYATYVLEGRFLKGESAIARSGYWALQYAQNILKGPFPQAEAVIAECPHHSVVYAGILDVYCEDGRFIAGEPAISKHAESAYIYAHIISDYSLESEAILKKLENINHNSVAEATKMVKSIIGPRDRCRTQISPNGVVEKHYTPE